MRRSGVQPPLAPPAENTDRMGLFCTFGAVAPDEFGATRPPTCPLLTPIIAVGLPDLGVLACKAFPKRVWPSPPKPGTEILSGSGGLQRWSNVRVGRLAGSPPLDATHLVSAGELAAVVLAAKAHPLIDAGQFVPQPLMLW
jgi:hypothetical protein